MEKTEGGPSGQEGPKPATESGAQKEEVLSLDERLVLRMREVKIPYRTIAQKVFGREMSRQGAWETVLRLTGKSNRAKSRERYRGRELVCPINELPQSERTRNALSRAGYQRLGQIVGLTDKQLSDIQGLGRVSLHELRRMMREWGLEQPDLFCLRCAGGLRVGKRREQTLTCSVCGQTYQLLRNRNGKGLQIMADKVTVRYTVQPGQR